MALVTFQNGQAPYINDDNLNNNFSYVVPTGGIVEYAGHQAPNGWLMCDGREVNRSTYAELFSIIGTTYGSGDGSTTFNLPNLCGKVPVGRTDNDTSFDTLGETGGEKTHTLTINEMPTHNHGRLHWNDSGGDTVSLNSGGTAYRIGWDRDGFNSDGFYMEDAGGDQPHNNLQPYIVLHYIIKY